uniref:Uncharacterized protein n=1 Tax=Anguilla anguilla TaxID=7936 RepID=A0A0E9UIR8_ANGAN
MVSTVSGLGEC